MHQVFVIVLLYMYVQYCILSSLWFLWTKQNGGSSCDKPALPFFMNYKAFHMISLQYELQWINSSMYIGCAIPFFLLFQWVHCWFRPQIMFSPNKWIIDWQAIIFWLGKMFSWDMFSACIVFQVEFAIVYSTFIKQHQQDVPITAISFMVHKVKFMSVSLDKIKNTFWIRTLYLLQCWHVTSTCS